VNEWDWERGWLDVRESAWELEAMRWEPSLEGESIK
jgi:hypothetical protein